MKKINLMLLGLVLIPFKVNAAIALRCAPDNVEAGSEINCILYGPSSCYTFEGVLDLPDGLSLSKVTPYKNYEYNGSSLELKFNGPGNNAYEKMALLSIKAPNIKSDSNFEIKIKDIKFKYLSSDTKFSTNADLKSTVKVHVKTTTSKTTSTTKSTTTTKNKNFVLYLDANGGDLAKQTISCTPSGGTCDVDLNNVNMPVREGYTFKGWADNKECNNGVNGVVSLTKDETYYACWSGEKVLDKDITLKSLSIKDVEFVFNKDVFEYNIQLDSDKGKLDILTEVDDNIKVDVSGNDKLQVGNNVIVITLSKNNSYNIYKLNVLKSDGTSINYGDKTLSNLNINGYNINFDSLTFSYDLEIDNNTKVLDISPTLTNGNYTYEIIGNDNLKDGSIIRIVIKDLNGNTNTYFINIIKNSFISQNKLYFILGGAIIGCLIIYLIVGAKMKKKKNKSNKTEEEIEVLNV